MTAYIQSWNPTGFQPFFNRKNWDPFTDLSSFLEAYLSNSNSLLFLNPLILAVNRQTYTRSSEDPSWWSYINEDRHQFLNWIFQSFNYKELCFSRIKDVQRFDSNHYFGSHTKVFLGYECLCVCVWKTFLSKVFFKWLSKIMKSMQKFCVKVLV